MMWKQQPAHLPPTWFPLAPLLQHCRLAPDSGGVCYPPSLHAEAQALARGLQATVCMPAQPLAFLLSMPSRGSLAFPVVKLLWL